MPSEHYVPSRGVQSTWEVSFRGEHVAKRSFLKYGGEAMAAKHVLWEAWAHHFRRTGEPCPIPWLRNLFGKPAGDDAAQHARLDSATLASLGQTRVLPKKRRAGPAAAVPDTKTAEPGIEAAEPGPRSRASSGSIPAAKAPTRRKRPVTKAKPRRAKAKLSPATGPSSSSSSSASCSSSSSSSSESD